MRSRIARPGTRRLHAAALITTFTLWGCADALTPHARVVARVGAQELTVEALAELFVIAPTLPLTRDAADGMARHWVDLMVVASRAAVGDSLLDSATVFEAMWPDVRRSLISALYRELFAEQATPNAEAIDSAYRLGETRIISHVLRQVVPEGSPEDSEAQRAVAAGIRRALRSGGSWESANEQNQDETARLANGSLGVIGRGETVPAFEEVAFALAPGEVSEVIETDFGFHIAYRPRLDDVREEFRRAVERELATRFDSVHGERLLEVKDAEVYPGAPATVRAVLEHPLRAIDSSKPLASYDRGRFTVGQFVRWAQLFAPSLLQQVREAPDDQVLDLIRRLLAQELLWLQADSAGLELADSIFDIVRSQHRGNLITMWEAAGISPDMLVRGAGLVEDRERLAALRVQDYLRAFAAQEIPLSPVQPFLAARLRRNADWEVVAAGVERVVERADRMRAGLSGAAPIETPQGFERR